MHPATDIRKPNSEVKVRWKSLAFFFFIRSFWKLIAGSCKLTSYLFKGPKINKENLHMFSLGNWIVSAALGSGGQEPFLERLATDREALCSAASTVGKMYILLLVTWLPSLLVATTVFCNIHILACSTCIRVCSICIYICVAVSIHMYRYTVYIIPFVNSKSRNNSWQDCVSLPEKAL